MSELLDRLKVMRQIPLFPLPLVLLPGEMLPLHIFEPRYREMIADINDSERFFGVLTFQPQTELETRPAEGAVGCLAEVKEIQALPDGASNIVTIGIMRFRLIDYVETDRSYFVGDIEFFEDDENDADEVSSLADEVHELFERVAKAAFQLGGSRGQFPEIPKTNSEQLSFLISTAFNLDVDLKYRMIETTSTRVRLEKLREILLGTVSKMEDSAEIHKVAQTNGHSKKKLDL